MKKMLFRCLSISRTSAWGRSINSLTSLHSRNHHAIGNALYRLNGSDQNENKIQSSPHHRMVLNQISAPVLVSARNLSFIPRIFASSAAFAPAIEIAANGEPTFSSLGLGGYSPIGLFQWGLEFMHVSLDLPWYATIALSSVIIRIMLTPLILTSKRNAAVRRNIRSEIQDLQDRKTQARQIGNAVEYAKAKQQRKQLKKSRGYNRLQDLLISFVRISMSLSVFFGIHQMMNTPVESLETGGLWWFTDLTMVDPYCLLPLLTSGILALTIHLGLDGQKTPRTMLFLECIPCVIFLFTMNFSAAIVVYWASGNFCTLIQGRLFKMPKVQRFINPVNSGITGNRNTG